MLPDLNKRVLKVIEYKTNRNVNKFSEFIGIKQQSVNRLFSIDSRTGKYPTPTTELFVAIFEKIPEINPNWLLIGKGEMLCDELPKTIDEKKPFGKIPPNVDVELLLSKNRALEELCEKQKTEIDQLKTIIASKDEVIESKNQLITYLTTQKNMGRKRAG
jgi:hypothetical protein